MRSRSPRLQVETHRGPCCSRTLSTPSVFLSGNPACSWKNNSYYIYLKKLIILSHETTFFLISTALLKCSAGETARVFMMVESAKGH